MKPLCGLLTLSVISGQSKIMGKHPTSVYRLTIPIRTLVDSTRRAGRVNRLARPDKICQRVNYFTSPGGSLRHQTQRGLRVSDTWTFNRNLSRTAMGWNHVTWLSSLGATHRLYRHSVLTCCRAQIHVPWFIYPLQIGEPDCNTAHWLRAVRAWNQVKIFIASFFNHL